MHATRGSPSGHSPLYTEQLYTNFTGLGRGILPGLDLGEQRGEKRESGETTDTTVGEV